MGMQPYEKKHLKELRAYLAECTVLLKSNGAFPLDGACPVALYGSGARRTVPGGTGSGEVNARFTVSVEKGMEKSGFHVTTKDWLDEYDHIIENARRQFLHQIKSRAGLNVMKAILDGMGAVMPEPEYLLPLSTNAEVAVYVLSRISGEGSDRRPVAGDVLLTKTEIRDILALQRMYGKFMLVLNVGGPVDLSPVMEVENILVLSQLGAGSGIALADILLGKTVPSGKLTATWSAWKDYPGIGDFGAKDDTRYREGIYVGYRYFDSVGMKPLFPFGFGLSYTEFSVTKAAAGKNGSMITVTADVRNTGKVHGKETLQLYVSAPARKLDQPFQSLIGFAKTKNLPPGKCERLSISFRLRDLASFSEESSAYILEEGNYLIRLGNSSANTVPVVSLFIKDEIVVRRVRPSLGDADFTDWKPESAKEVIIPSGLPVIEVTSQDIPEEKVSCLDDREIDPLVKPLTDEELMYLNIGSFHPGGGIADVIGSSGRSVAGAAGETTGLLKEKGINTVVMADGPAGLRISRKYFIHKGKVQGIGSPLPATIADLLPAFIVHLTDVMAKNPKRGDQVHSQYATFLPVGTALAQSWNLDAARLCGDIVGDEMERFGIHLWLSPALNIHRSILCGRNYEYYSEDPLLSGLMAAAVTDGVQKHKGCGATIKHFMANNQEFNRYTNNSIVSRRALREIYLRGFEICIRESAPMALMTSYNLVNGIHTSERRELIEDVLRQEFGFTGVVMTDWTVPGFGNQDSAHPPACADRICAAGVNLVMPGSSTDFSNLKKAMKEGRISRERLERNASYVARTISQLIPAKNL